MPGYRRRHVLTAVTVIAVGGVVVFVMPRRGQTPPAAAVPPSVAPPSSAAAPPQPEAVARSVVELFAASCAACHGDGGKGDGPNAALLDPRPRDFTTQALRYGATGGTREQVLGAVERTIRRGLPHSAMPGFGAVMSPVEIASLADLVLARGGDHNRVAVVGSELKIPEPPEFTPGLIGRGREVYLANICASCHGTMGQANGAGAPGLTDMDGNPILPADLSSPLHKSGTTDQDIYRTILMGVPGTPMAAYKPMVARSRPDAPPDDRDAWALVALIDSFSPPSPPLPDPVVRAASADGAALTDPAAPAWFDIHPVRVMVHPARYTPGLPGAVELRASRSGGSVAVRISGADLPLGSARVVAAPRGRAGAPLVILPAPLPDGYDAFQSGTPGNEAVIASGAFRDGLVFQVVFATPDPADAAFTGWITLTGP